MADELARRTGLILLAFVLRQIHHQRYMSIHVCTRSRLGCWGRDHWLEDNAGNRYVGMPWPLDATTRPDPSQAEEG